MVSVSPLCHFCCEGPGGMYTLCTVCVRACACVRVCVCLCIILCCVVCACVCVCVALLKPQGMSHKLS